ncbi:DUF221-domain-containing protein [Thozetella sp. PMI_491]|nr:DUF221-domain-containing protein [Thozetella sp. PMI_491]
MDMFEEPPDKSCTGRDFVQPGNTDIKVQLVLSLALGVTAFMAFCILRPRWPGLYAARKRHLDPSIGIPTLPTSFFGWIPSLYRITEEQVLAAAGLDAYVFLAFFKMAIKLFSVMFFFAAVILEPINHTFVPNGHFNISDPEDPDPPALFLLSQDESYKIWSPAAYLMREDNSYNSDMGYLWAYLIFTYFFTFLTLYFMDAETFKVIQIRQNYLGSQSTVTDRTFRLSKIPKELRSEEKIKDLVERLEIGLVDSITLCRDWEQLDALIYQRDVVLRRLETAWSDYIGRQSARPAELPSSEPSNVESSEANHIVDEEAGEDRQFLESSAQHYVEGERPRARIWYGFLRLQSRKVDAIDYYEEKLRRFDEQIKLARKKEYKPMDAAFITMDSIAACQMAIQALIDPHPGQLLTKPAPAPSDIVWPTTYSSRFSRQVRGWTITLFVAVLTVIWLIPVAFIASVLSLCAIRKVFPAFVDSLNDHEIAKALVQTGLPTAVVSLLNVAVPYLYDYLSYHQGMLSQGDIALSVISKNFFFTFFNIFLVFTVFGTASGTLSVILGSLTDTTAIAFTLAREIQKLSVFYLNFIMLQGIGLFPFRLLEFGSVFLYPIMRFLSKTPRDRAEVAEPPIFSYGFYLPTALLVFILCVVYSILPRGFMVLLLGLIYFTLGYFTYKYQLVFAMDQPQHATGGAWTMICYRIFLGLAVFQVTMSGLLALQSAFAEAVLVIPLLLGTVWYSYEYKRQFEPLTRFISLRSIRRGEHMDESTTLDASGVLAGPDRETRLLRRRSTIDEDREKGTKFVNPNLVLPLVQPWIYHDPPPLQSEGSESENGTNFSPPQLGPPAREDSANAGAGGSTTSSVSLGDTHIWRDA